MEWHPSGFYLPTPNTRVLLACRASGDAAIGSWSGVSGYVDVLSDPQEKLKDEFFDPVAYAGRTELHEEARISRRKISAIDLHLGAIISRNINLALGQRFEELRYTGNGVVKVLPMLGICHSWWRPRVRPNRTEISALSWVRLGEVHRHPNLADGYLTRTLPSALGSLGLTSKAIAGLLYPQH